MSNSNSVVLSQAAPSYAVVQTKGGSSFAAALLGGVGGGGGKRLSIKQSRWRIYEGGEEVAVKNEPHVDVAIIRANPNINKQFFLKNYVPGQEPEAPDCYSHDGVTPSPNARAPQCNSCAACPNNVWGSKISPTGAKIKACADRKLVAVKFADQLLTEGSDIYRLAIPGASLKDFGGAVRQIMTKGVDPAAVVFRISFDLTAEFPKLQFAPLRYMTAEEYECAKEDEQTQDAMFATSEMGDDAPAAAAAPADSLGEPPAAAQTTQAAVAAEAPAATTATTSRRRAQPAAAVAQSPAETTEPVVEQAAPAPRRRAAAAAVQQEVVVETAPDIGSNVTELGENGDLAAALSDSWDD